MTDMTSVIIARQQIAKINREERIIKLLEEILEEVQKINGAYR